eukprot:TRINITY_DN15659_c0_g1_i12.p4 TRINITY_DN15659_c0_g1~~TRINITY_DN15659_c0_g1_i12.p4  ORF type:complete len:212 (+),score=24.29 TRINITY_DN15659_c0_g1_i12:787-1422(+)
MIELQANPKQAEELVRLRAALDGMRDDPEHAPDFSPAILDELHKRKGFLAGPMWIFGSATRIAAVLGLIVSLGVLAMLRERAEGVFTPEPSRPMTQVVSTVEEELSDCVRSLGSEAMELGVNLRELPEQARYFQERMCRAPKPLATEEDRRGTFQIVRSNTESRAPSAGHLPTIDLRFGMDNDANAWSAIWVVGSGSRWTPDPLAAPRKKK